MAQWGTLVLPASWAWLDVMKNLLGYLLSSYFPWGHSYIYLLPLSRAKWFLQCIFCLLNTFFARQFTGTKVRNGSIRYKLLSSMAYIILPYPWKAARLRSTGSLCYAQANDDEELVFLRKSRFLTCCFFCCWVLHAALFPSVGCVCPSIKL